MEPAQEHAPEPAAEPARTRRRLLRLVQVAGTAAAFAYLFSTVDPGSLARAAGRISLGTFALAILVILAALALASMRWRWLFVAFGAPSPPGWFELCRAYLIGFFYNTFLPGGMVGDVVRGVASRGAFGASGSTTGGLAVVFFERVMGLTGMLLLTATITTLHPLEGIPYLIPFGIAGVLAAAGVLLALALSQRLAPHMPRRIGELMVALPVPQRYLPIVGALLLSVVVHALSALSGHLMIAAIQPGVDPLDSFVIVPLSMSTAFIPISVSGAGVREAAFATLYGFVGVPRDAAVAAALAAWASQAVVAAFGGVLTLLAPIGAGRQPAA
jgi:uncharacterized membrane protein YbhN (UPF0104 family)